MAQIPFCWDGTDAAGNPLRWDTPGLFYDGFVPQPNQKKMPQIHVSLSFASAPDNDLDELALAVIQKLYANALYASPPVTSAALTTAKTDFSAAVAAANLGGPADTALKNNRRAALIELLRELANFVEGKHKNNLADLLASGFEANSTTRSSVPLGAPSIKDILNANSGQLRVRVTPITNARCYEARYAPVAANGAPGPWVDGGTYTDSRNILLTALTPGTNYMVEVRAIGGSTGSSDWSDSVSHMSM